MNVLNFFLDMVVKLFAWAQADFWDVLLVAFMFVGLCFLVGVSLNPRSPYNFRDNLIDDATGKASFRHLAGFVALASSTWVFLKWGSLGTLPQWYGDLYFITWALVLMVPRLADVIANVFAARFGAAAAPADKPPGVAP